jgi:hypothetical protein
MKKAIRKRTVKKKPVTMGFRQKLSVKILVFQAWMNSVKARFLLTMRKAAAKLRGH